MEQQEAGGLNPTVTINNRTKDSKRKVKIRVEGARGRADWL